jgi:putative ABC transport system permease protein
MIKIHFLSAQRSLRKNRSIAIINICGLTLGLTAFIFILHYLFYELSFDSFFPGSSSVYRINSDIKTGEEVFYHGTKTSRGLYFALRNEVPGIATNGDAYFESCLIRFAERQAARQRVLWVDEGFEKVFPLHFIKGTADFTRPLTGIIARSKVPVLFGLEDPVGKIMKVNEGMPVEITGVFDDLPSNTHLTADYFISLKTWEHYNWISRNRDWNYNGYWNYVKLSPGVDLKAMEETLTRLVNTNTSERVSQRKSIITLQPLSDLHFVRGLDGEMGSQTNPKSLIVLSVIALLTIIIAWINYVNLSTALAAKRADEIGMRKLIGASGLHLWLQSFIETAILNIVVLLFTIILYRILLNPFALYFKVPLSQAVVPVRYVFISLVAVLLLGILLTSLYNSVTLSRYSPFSGKRSVKHKRSFQKGMVIAQMSLSVIFISITITVYKQILYMKKAETGINLKQVITLNAPASLNIDTAKRTKYLSFRRDLLQEPIFESATANTFTPGQAPVYGYTEYIRPDAGIRPNSRFFENTGDDGLVETFSLKLLAGKYFSSQPNENRRKVMLNESSVRELGFKSSEDAVGKKIYRANRDSIPIEVIGVLADFHNEGLQKPIYPMVYNNAHPYEFGYYSVRLSTTEITSSLSSLEKIWKKHYPYDPFEYFFADEFFFRQYQSEARFGKFYTLLTILSITIACLGLYGLIVFYLDQKKREIGLRKINGAEIHEILITLTRDFAGWVSIAFIIAIPISYYVMRKWLQNFAYRTELSWWIFVLAGVIVLIIALLSVSWQSWRAATRNPVESLRYE